MAKFTDESRLRAAAKRQLRKDAELLFGSSGIALDSQAEAKVIARLGEMPETQRVTYIAAMQGNSPTSAIAAFCSMCVGWRREEVALCTDPACPLYPYRPGS